jgi:hypothetical protein
MLRRWTHDLVLCTDGARELPTAHRHKLDEEGILVEEDRIMALEGAEGRLQRVHFASGESIAREALFFHHPASEIVSPAENTAVATASRRGHWLHASHTYSPSTGHERRLRTHAVRWRHFIT